MAAYAAQQPYKAMPVLSADQQKLLYAALTSNNRQLNMSQFRDSAESPETQGIDPHVFESDAQKETSTPTRLPTFGDPFMPDFTNGHYTDYDVDLPQDVLDNLGVFQQAEMGEKRKSPEDDDEADDEDTKRHEGDDKTPKKPGRKPLTAEPTTKRKAQNRAAQRAFRERKEKHLKDLEDKITNLTKASETANHENSLLRAQVVTLQSELNDYKKRLSSGAGISSTSRNSVDFPYSQSGLSGFNNPFDFAFEAPVTKSPQTVNDSANKQSSTGNQAASRHNSTSQTQASPRNTTQNPQMGSISRQNSRTTASNMFTPGFFNMGSNVYNYPQFGSPNSFTATGDSPPFTTNPGLSTRSVSVTSHASPSTSQSSNLGPSSSCGTSPEPVNDSQVVNKTETPQDSWASSLGNLADFQFDPTIFGNYRETQDAIYGEGDFSGGLYDDYLNIPSDVSFLSNEKTKSPPAPKPNLMDEVARQQNAGPEDNLVPPDATEQRQMMTCHKIWQQLSNCPKFQDGDLDIDGLCSELSKKATCTEKGGSIPKEEWEAALWKMVGTSEPPPSKPSTA